jgi:hypothetical protein
MGSGFYPSDVTRRNQRSQTPEMVNEGAANVVIPRTVLLRADETIEEAFYFRCWQMSFPTLASRSIRAVGFPAGGLLLL